jgi:hypothetical protein
MFLIKFDVGISYVFKVGIIVITFKFVFIRSKILFSKLSKFLGNFFVIYIFFPTRTAKLRKFEI